MIVVDTSVWVEHIRGRDTPLDRLLVESSVLMHPFVHGELLLHGLPRNGALAATFENLEAAPLASCDEVAALIGWEKLASTGIGYVDAHLLASTRMIGNGQIVTFDQCLLAQAERLGIAYRKTA